MDFFTKLTQAIECNQSLLCVGLDPDPQYIPERYDNLGDKITGLLNWNQTVIRETEDKVCAYKPNIAFYEALGVAGIALLHQTLRLIPKHIPIILDAKRGDIGNTAMAYASACFKDLKADAVTLSPYLGRDSIEPFTTFTDKGLFVLCHTSNHSSEDFQTLEINDWRTLDRENNQPLYIHVARTAPTWSPNVGLVVGATYPEAMAAVRRSAPDTWFLVPGIGAQGGDLAATLSAGLREDGSGMIIHVSRGINQADNHSEAALTLKNSINQVRKNMP